jgi:hypothetical protein
MSETRRSKQQTTEGSRLALAAALQTSTGQEGD